ncbi:ferritin-like domain-containing protein [Phototrophicus methaneseepsis]|uniref:Ferritin-like domain-containing protein n=1 Tax=Phototrophicus methaneseepsis TaxID=2710758 RepID=A0A7S8IG59_9CHLR|nr:ferritin-like domain-containing protein [Phototrophicus methaneseepsis]QPC84224.1 ferritin-like domain-containing protein [Phototrophicus methaneseepsis]
MTQTKQNGLSRRDMLKSSLIGIGATTLSWSSLFGISRVFAQETSGTNDDVQTILNLAATAELFATTHYLAAINATTNGDLDLDDIELNYMKTAFISEQDHYDLLVSLGAEPLVSEFYVPDGLFSDVALFSEITEVAETTFVSAYLAATRIFTELGEAAFAVTTAQIAGVESEHRALVRQIGRRLPNDRSYENFQFSNVSDAVPVLQPFLDGTADGFVGPVAAPTADQIAAIRAEAGELGYTGDIQPYAAMDMAAASSSEDTSTESMAGGVTATSGSQDVNIREMPSTSSNVVSVLTANSSTTIDGQRMGSDGYVWWHVASGGWIRSDTVSETDGANDLPEM